MAKIQIIAENRKAHFDYQLGERYEAGIVLTGTEIKSVCFHHTSIADSYVIIKDNEAYVLNMHIAKYQFGNIFNHEEVRTRKLLLHKKEIMRINEIVKKQQVTLIPTKLYRKDGMAKIEFAIAKGKKKQDKRLSEKEKSVSKEIRANLGAKH